MIHQIGDPAWRTKGAPCLVCNPPTKEIEELFSRKWFDDIASQIVICEPCRKGILAFRFIAGE